MKRSITCPECEYQYLIVYDDNLDEVPVVCSFCGHTLDELPEDPDPDTPKAANDGLVWELDEASDWE
jgi:hypothetical protein